MSKMIRVSKKLPCHICQGDHKCSFSEDGLILCGRMTGDVPGFKCLGPSKNPTWTMYKASAGLPIRAATTAPATPRTLPPISLAEQAKTFARAFSPLCRADLARELQLPTAAVDLIPDVGWDDNTQAYTIPEVDAHGTVIGIATRKPDGTKRCIPGSRRGLVLPAGWVDTEGPLFVVEGMSDAIALGVVGLGAIGRPSSHVGGDTICELLNSMNKNRPIFVFGENDQKPDGRWPGKEGAEAIAKQLASAFPDRTVLCACPPDGFKDARQWVLSRLGPWDPYPKNPPPDQAIQLRKIGQDIAHAFGQAAKRFQAQPSILARRWPAPVDIRTIAAEVESDPNPTGWLWDGYLPRNGIAILSALPKCGKTTLLTHLLASLASGGEFLGRTVLPGRAVVLTEEDKSVWAERQKRHQFGDSVALLIRPFLGRPSHDDWASFLSSLTADLEADSRDLIILDTLADIWPVRDENHATDVTDCLKPLRKLAAAGRSVLCIHHVRKSGGENGVASRGSGAIAGFFDVMLELGYASGDPDGRRRKLTAKGRLEGIPGETLVEMAKDGMSYRQVDARTVTSESVKRREETEEDRREALRVALREIVPHGSEANALTREEIWNRLPEAVRVNVKRFESVLEEHVAKGWNKFGVRGKVGGFRYAQKPIWEDQMLPD